jgi:hypothetical protein
MGSSPAIEAVVMTTGAHRVRNKKEEEEVGGGGGGSEGTPERHAIALQTRIVDGVLCDSSGPTPPLRILPHNTTTCMVHTHNRKRHMPIRNDERQGGKEARHTPPPRSSLKCSIARKVPRQHAETLMSSTRCRLSNFSRPVCCVLCVGCAVR